MLAYKTQLEQLVAKLKKEGLLKDVTFILVGPSFYSGLRHELNEIESKDELECMGLSVRTNENLLANVIVPIFDQKAGLHFFW